MPHAITEQTQRQIRDFARRYNLPPQVGKHPVSPAGATSS